jgi:DivIVA domain-containing protein
VALDRQSIEKKDFPIGRRGYDPGAVDAHLRLLADEVDELRRSARRGSESLATAASEQVRSIVGAAEATAAEIRRQAENEAREIRAAVQNELHVLIESLQMGSDRLKQWVEVAPAAGEILAEPTPGVDATASPNGSADVEGARLVALNMAIDGRSREETERYLAKHFRLMDGRRLVDDIYAAFGG